MTPSDLPEGLWDEFKKHRKKLRAPMTEHAEGLILAKLDKWKLLGADPADVINESIEKGWRGILLNGHGGKQLNPAHALSDLGDKRGQGENPRPPLICCMCKGPL